MRDGQVTGVQTCDLMISDAGCRVERVGAVAAGQRGGGLEMRLAAVDVVHRQLARGARVAGRAIAASAGLRSGERRVGEGGGSRWGPYPLKKKDDDLE